jgi:divalent metal cation (Fe/Co/Zn/Cd) transporter
MTKLLLRLFVKNPEDTANPKTRSAVGKLSGIVGILSNLLLFAGKLIVGTLSGSVSITADAMNNLSDASSSIVTFLGFKLAEKPADEDHPYGHARFEYLSGLAVAALIIVIGFELAKTSVQKILNPSAVTFSLVTICVLIGSIAIKLWLSIFNRTLGKKIHSSALNATAADSRNDCISTGAVLLAGIVEYSPHGASTAIWVWPWLCLSSGAVPIWQRRPSIPFWAKRPVPSCRSESWTMSAPIPKFWVTTI